VRGTVEPFALGHPLKEYHPRVIGTPPRGLLVDGRCGFGHEVAWRRDNTVKVIGLANNDLFGG
jgi:hypothetical protein